LFPTHIEGKNSHAGAQRREKLVSIKWDDFGTQVAAAVVVAGILALLAWAWARRYRLMARPWAIALVTAVPTAIVTSAVVLAFAGIPGPPGPPGTPRDAVLAFNGPCPSPDWEPFIPAVARFVIGAGIPPNDSSFQKWKRQLPTGGFEEVNLTPRTLLEPGGEENRVLTILQMPSHTHNEFRATSDGTGLYPKADAMGPQSQAIVALHKKQVGASHTT
jgi:hypothetical protein